MASNKYGPATPVNGCGLQHMGWRMMVVMEAIMILNKKKDSLFQNKETYILVKAEVMWNISLLFINSLNSPSL